ncbi:MAG: single-stranded DNA-binding protein [Treponema sp.]|nr:single-stranded DNA-binding protein [Treponema sp.]
MNSVIIEGNITNEPVVNDTGNGGVVCNFKIASDRFYKKNAQLDKEVSFIEIQAWGKLAETIGRYGHKGRGVRVSGRLKQDKWEGQDGTPRSKIIIIAEHVELRKEETRDVKEESGEEIEGAE